MSSIDRKYQLIERLKTDISTLEKKRTEDLQRIEFESRGHIVPEMRKLRADQVNAMYDGQISELQDEINILKMDSTVINSCNKK